MNAMTDLTRKMRARLAASMCCAAILGALLAGCGSSPEESTTGAVKSGTTTQGVAAGSGDDAEKPEDGKTGGTPDTHTDK